MMESLDSLNKNNREDENDIFSVPIKAGKRIYYFDVKSTRGNDFYVTVTESRKRNFPDGGFVIDKHKIHLYKEDFDKFVFALQEVINYTNNLRNNYVKQEEVNGASSLSQSEQL